MPSAVAIIPSLYLQLVLLLSLRRERRVLRACCSDFTQAGDYVISMLLDVGCRCSLDPVVSRLLFWSPWRGTLCVYRRDSICVQHFDAVWLGLRARGHVNPDYPDRFELHGASDDSILYKSVDKIRSPHKYVDTIVIWKAIAMV